MFVTDISGKADHPGRSAAVSLAVHFAAIILAVLIGGPVTHFIAQPRSVALVASSEPPPRVRTVPNLPVHTARPAIQPPQPPKLALPSIELPQAPTVEAARTLLPAPDLPRVVVLPPAPPVKTGEFAEAAPAVLKQAPKLSLQSSGFASAETPRGTVPRGQLSAASSGFDNGGPVNQGPRHLAVTGSGFSDAAPVSGPARERQAIAKSSFGDAASERPTTSAPRGPAAASLSSPVDILSKPRPAYTAEARALGIEGEVLVEVVFEAAGTVRVLRLVKGLGHGLDESALAAAHEIRFKPSRRDGLASDATAVVHIVFQLAY